VRKNHTWLDARLADCAGSTDVELQFFYDGTLLQRGGAVARRRLEPRGAQARRAAAGGVEHALVTLDSYLLSYNFSLDTLPSRLSGPRSAAGHRSAWPIRPARADVRARARRQPSPRPRDPAAGAAGSSSDCCFLRRSERAREHRGLGRRLRPVNLNFTAGRDGMAAAIGRCGIETVLTSRTFLAKAGIPQARA